MTSERALNESTSAGPAAQEWPSKDLIAIPARDLESAVGPEERRASSEEQPASTAPRFPKATVAPTSKPRSVSRLWGLTIVCLIVAIGLVIGGSIKRGPTITIQFSEGHGLKAGDTLRYRGIVVGEVTDVDLAPQLAGVLVTVVLEHQAAHLARQDSEFWIERPQVRLSRVSGLETVVGAKYLAVRPGPEGTRPVFRFEGVESPPVLTDSEFTEISIQFTEGHGLQTGDPVRHRGILIGEVTSVDLQQKLSGVAVRVRLTGAGRNVAKEGSQFWIERPRVTALEVRGLETLVGGRYLALSPAPETAAPCVSFVGLETAPVAPAPVGGIEIVLHAPQRWGIDRGVPITYRGLTVGHVHSVGLSSDGTRIEAQAFIEAQYRNLVRRNSVFWSTSGIDMNLGLTGLQLTADTLSTIAQGGIAFATPESPAEPASSGQRFPYEKSGQDEWQKWRPHISMSEALSSAIGRRPEPVRAVVRWTEKSFGFSRNRERSGWSLFLDNGQILAPADLLNPLDQDTAEVWLEVAGLRIKLDPGKVDRQGAWALIAGNDSVPEGINSWPRREVRTAAEPEDILVIAASPSGPHPLTASSLRPVGDDWDLDHAGGLNPAWHGAPVVAVKDGKLIGLLVFRQGKPLVAKVSLNGKSG